MERVHLTKERLLKGPVLGNQVWWGKCTTSADGKPKYLALSKAMDTFEHQDMEATRISSLQLLSKNLWVNKGEGPQCLLVVSLGMFLTKKNLVISTNRKNLFSSKANQDTLRQNAYSIIVHLKYTKVS